MSSIAIITARGGSKRIPGKNIREFCGLPIIAYSIKAAIESGVFDTVMVSTDSTQIADIARKFGAEIPFMRSDATSDDHATTSDVLIEVLDKYAGMGVKYDLACCIYPTAPFISAKRLQEAQKILETNVVIDTVITVAPYEILPQRALNITDGIIVPSYPEDYWKRTQDLEKKYHDCGQFYFFKTDRFLKTKCLEENAAPLILSPLETQDIDTDTDWKLAELKYSIISSVSRSQ